MIFPDKYLGKMLQLCQVQLARKGQLEKGQSLLLLLLLL